MRRFVCLLIPLLLAAPAAQGKETAPREPRFEAKRAAAFEAALEAERQRQGLIGLAVAVIEKGKLVHVTGLGLADRDAKRPVTERTLFRWASVSKPVTAVAALQLVERGALRLDAPARTYWASLPKTGLGAVPVDALLRHQGGVGHYGQMGDWQKRLDRHYGDRARIPWSAEKSVRVLADPPLLSAPYASYHYTSFGYNLLGALIGSAGKQPFPALVDAHIATPLGMTTFEPDYEFQKRPGRTRGYRKRGDRIVDARPGDVSWKLPGGGFHSTVGDMARFGVGLLGDRLLKPATRKRMFTVRQPKSGTTRYALGLSVREKEGVVTRLSHSGSQARARTLLVLEPPTAADSPSCPTASGPTPASSGAPLIAPWAGSDAGQALRLAPLRASSGSAGMARVVRCRECACVDSGVSSSSSRSASWSARHRPRKNRSGSR